MKISKEEVMHVARLARLDLEEEVIETFSEQIGNILDYMETLNRVDTDGIEPTSHAISLNNAFREDVPAEHLETDAALSNAPAGEDGCFVVPKVVG